MPDETTANETTADDTAAEGTPADETTAGDPAAEGSAADETTAGDETNGRPAAEDAAEPEVMTPSVEHIVPAAPEGTTTPGSTDDERANPRKIREGLVVSTKMEKTAVVAVIERVRHPRYAKTVQRTKRFYAQEEGNDIKVGDRVRIAETRPLSKLKRWRVVEVLERAK
jgi:small subunit ribosomal protein S17